MNTSLFLNNNQSQFVIKYREELPKSKRDNHISASSQQKLKSQKKRYSSHLDDINNHYKKKKPSVHQSMHTQSEQKKQEKEYSRVPIEYMEERDHGNPADKTKGRVVYRGYAPKNTYFYFKTIKQLKMPQKNHLDKQFRGQEVYFSSKFQSGNLHAAVRISSRQYWLYMREDTNTHGLRQWFYFETKVKKPSKIKFRIYKFSKRCSLYKQGMKPFIKKTNTQWRQEGQKVTYEYDSEQKSFYLEFQYHFQDCNETYFANLPPYTYSMMNNYIETLSENDCIGIKKIGHSLCGLDLFGINIFGRQRVIKNVLDTELQEKVTKKQAIIVMARTHPGETVSNFALEGFIEKILNLPFLLQRFHFFIIPMVNPDGVFLGNHRTGVLGQDLNRKFHNIDIDFFPEIEAVEKYVIQIQKKHKIAFLFDLHGHSSKKNIFAFGEESQIGSKKYLLNRIIPRILANNIDSFKYDLCHFKSSKEKKKTARVYFSNKNGINSITFEESYGLINAGAMGITHWRNFGAALAEALLQYGGIQPDALMKSMYSYLEEDIKKQKTQIALENQAKKQKILMKLKAKQQKQKASHNQAGQLDKMFSKEIINSRSFVSEYHLFRIKSQQRVDHPQKQQNFSPNYGNQNKERKRVKSFVLYQQEQEEKEETDSEDQEELDSGDEEMQMKQADLENIKKDIIRVGVNKEGKMRQIYNMAQKRVQLTNQHYIPAFSQRLHHKNSSMAQRVFKFKSKQKEKQRSRQSQYPYYQNSSYTKNKDNYLQLPHIRKN